MAPQKILKSSLDYVESLDEQTKDVLLKYTSDDYFFQINDHLKEKKPFTWKYLEIMYKTLLLTFKNAPIFLSSLTVYRGSNESDVRFEKDFTANSFYSTSYDVNEALKFVEGEDGCLYIIQLNPGNYSILPLENVSEKPNEKEILLPPGGKFSIQNVLDKSNPLNSFSVTCAYITYIPEESMIIDTKK